MTGGSDPGNPACVASGESGSACEGPFKVFLQPSGAGETAGIWSEAGLGDAGRGDPVPRLSETGEEVAFISSALPVAIGAGFGTEAYGEPADLYVVDMHAGLTRDQAITPLTRIGGANEAADEPITDFDISPKGDQVAFTTARIEFPLGSPAYVSEPAAEAGESELFDVDLDNDTLTRVSHGYRRRPERTAPPVEVLTGARDPYQQGLSTPTAGAQSPSFTSNGEELAFSSTASNLVYGDGNTPPGTSVPETLPDGSDAFVVPRDIFESLPTPQDISPAPEAAHRTGMAARRERALARQRQRAALCRGPGAGTLRAGARARWCRVRRALASRAAHGPSRLGHSATARIRRRRPRARGDRRHAHGRARAWRRGRRAETLALALAPSPTPRSPRAAAGCRPKVSLTFAAPGHTTLRDNIPVTFLRKAKRPRLARPRPASVVQAGEARPRRGRP